MNRDDVYIELCRTPIVSGDILFNFHVRENPNSNMAPLVITSRNDLNNRLALTDYLVTEDLNLRLKMRTNGRYHLKVTIDIPIAYTVISQYLYLPLKSFQVLAAAGKFSVVENELE